MRARHQPWFRSTPAESSELRAALERALRAYADRYDLEVGLQRRIEQWELELLRRPLSKECPFAL